MNFLKQHKKKVQKAKNEDEKNIDLNDLTPEIIEAVTKITLLKAWAKRLRIPKYNSFNAATIKQLQEAIIIKIAKSVTRNDVVAHEESAEDAIKEYKAIDKFLDAFKRRIPLPDIYGKIGDEFVKLWNQLDDNQKFTFIRENDEVNSKRLNSLAYLAQFIDRLRDIKIDTTNDLAKRYIRRFLIKSELMEKDAKGNTKGEMKGVTDHPAFSNEFAEKFAALDDRDKLKFGGQYILQSQLHPLEALRKYLDTGTEKKNLGIGMDIEAMKKHLYNVAGDAKVIKFHVPGGLAKHAKDTHKTIDNLKRCVTKYRQKNLVITANRFIPPGMTDEVVVPTNDYRPEDFFRPSLLFYESLCKYHVYVSTPESNELTLTGPNKFTVQVFFLENGEIIDPTPSQLNALIHDAEYDNPFSIEKPDWILNTPISLVDPVYIKAISNQLSIWAGDEMCRSFGGEITKLIQEHNYNSLQHYYYSFLTFFAPFIPVNGVKYHIITQLEKGYITPAAYATMTLEEKTPEVDNIEKSIDSYFQKVPRLIVEKAWMPPGWKPLPEMVLLSKTMTMDEICPDFLKYKPEDIIVHMGKCYLITELLRWTQENKPIEMSSGFLKDIQNRYGHLKTEKFFYREADIAPGDFDLGIDTLFGEGKTREYYVDKKFYDKAHPEKHLRKTPVIFSEADIAAQFDQHFGVDKIIPDPVGMIHKLLQTDPSRQCPNCEGNIPIPKVRSLINRSDGSVYPIYFCDYQCMMDHNFQPRHTLSEAIIGENDDHRIKFLE